jgi:penicillin amidase
MPVPGWSGEFEWTGYVPFEELPTVLNPATHYIVTANNQVVPDEFPYLLGRDWEAPFRAQRIESLINAQEKVTAEDYERMQGDLYAAPVVKLQKYVAPLPTDNFLTRRALEYVKEWQGEMTPDSVACTVLESTYRALVRDLFAGRMSAETFRKFEAESSVHRVLIDRLLDDPNNDWWDAPETAARETRDDRLKTAYAKGVDALGQKFGDWPPDWKWGRVHYASFEHPFGQIRPLDLLLNYGPVPTGGNGYTVWNSGYRPGEDDFKQRAVSSMRFIADLSDWDRSLWMNTTGQSGQPLSAHYTDLVYKWRDIEYEVLPFSREAVERVKKDVLVLVP